MDPEYVKIGFEDEADTLRKQSGPWIVATVKQSIGWPSKPVTIQFAGETFLLLPEDEKYVPAIALRRDHSSESRRLILEFVSSMVWSERGSIHVDHWTGGSHLIRVAKGPAFGQVTTPHFHITYLPRTSNPQAKLALALFHEGTTLAGVHVPYSFLSFYKIINLVTGGKKGKTQMNWIRKHVDQLTRHNAVARLKELQSSSTEIGAYIYSSCRSAIAHAGDSRNPVVDPHNIADQIRLQSDLPIVINLAEIAIESVFGIETSQTIYKEHRYELSGFEPIFGPSLVAQLCEGESLKRQKIKALPRLSVRIWGKQPYAQLADMLCNVLSMEKGVVTIECHPWRGRFVGKLKLDFPQYRLKFDIFHHGHDDGAPEYIEDLVELDRYFWEYNGNGCLEVWSEDGSCLGRCEAFMPVNAIFDPKGYEERLAELQEELARRKSARLLDPSPPTW
jgi:hypothetical protein